MNEAPFETTLREYAGLIGRIASGYEFRASQQQDLVQEISLALWQALPRWRGEASLKTFIARIAHHCAVDHVIAQRRRAGDVEIDEQLVDDTANPESDTLRQQTRHQLLAAVQALPLPLRQVVMLSLEDFRPAEIAEVLGISTNNVNVRLSRGRDALRQRLEDHR